MEGGSKVSKYTLLLAIFSFVLIGFSSSVMSKTLEISLQNSATTSGSNTLGGVATKSFYNSCGVGCGSSTQNINNPSAANGNWSAEYGSEYVMIPVGDVITPIAIMPSVTLINDQLGRVTIDNGKVSSVTRTAVTRFNPSRNSYDYRPTLYISMCGANSNRLKGSEPFIYAVGGIKWTRVHIP